MPISKWDKNAWFWDGDHMQARCWIVTQTELGKKVAEGRAKIVASGTRLLDEDEIERGVNGMAEETGITATMNAQLIAEVERLRAENAALQTDAALGRAVEAMPEGCELYHCGSRNARDPHKPWYGRFWHVGELVEAFDAATPGAALALAKAVAK